MKTKFNPKDVPEWAKWIAVDADGKGWAYEIMPNNDADEWMPKTLFHSRYKLLYKGKQPKNWESELYTWGY